MAAKKMIFVFVLFLFVRVSNSQQQIPPQQIPLQNSQLESILRTEDSIIYDYDDGDYFADIAAAVPAESRSHTSRVQPVNVNGKLIPEPGWLPISNPRPLTGNNNNQGQINNQQPVASPRISTPFFNPAPSIGASYSKIATSGNVKRSNNRNESPPITVFPNDTIVIHYETVPFLENTNNNNHNHNNNVPPLGSKRNERAIPGAGTLEERINILLNSGNCVGLDVNQLLVDLLKARLRVRAEILQRLQSRLKENTESSNNNGNKITTTFIQPGFVQDNSKRNIDSSNFNNNNNNFGNQNSNNNFGNQQNLPTQADPDADTKAFVADRFAAFPGFNKRNHNSPNPFIGGDGKPLNALDSQRVIEQERLKQLEEVKRKEEDLKRQQELEKQRIRELEEKRAKEQREREARRLRELEEKRQLEAKRKAEEEARRKKELEEQRRREEEAKRQREIEEKRRREKEARRQRELQEKKKREEEARRQAEIEAKRQKELEEKRRREEEAKRQREIEEQRKRELEAKRQREIEEKKRREEEARKQREFEEQKRREEEAKRQRELEAQRQRELEEKRLRELQEQQERLEKERQTLKALEEQRLKLEREEAERKRLQQQQQSQQLQSNNNENNSNGGNRGTTSIQKFLERYPEVKRVSSRFGENQVGVVGGNNNQNNNGQPSNPNGRAIGRRKKKGSRRKSNRKQKQQQRKKQQQLNQQQQKQTSTGFIDIFQTTTQSPQTQRPQQVQQTQPPPPPRQPKKIDDSPQSNENDFGDFDDDGELTSDEYSYLYYQEYYDELVPEHHRFKDLAQREKDYDYTPGPDPTSSNQKGNNGNNNIVVINTQRPRKKRPQQKQKKQQINKPAIKQPPTASTSPPRPPAAALKEMAVVNDPTAIQAGPFGYPEKGHFFSDADMTTFPERIEITYQGFVWMMKIGYPVANGGRLHGGIHTILKDKVKKEIVRLKDDKIIRVTGRASPYNINRLTFYTKDGKQYGPWGDRRSEDSVDFDVSAPEGQALAYFSGTVSKGVPVRSISFHWRPIN